MLTIGIILILIASIVRGWGELNYKMRAPCDAALAASSPFLMLVISFFAILIGITASILIGFQISFWIGIMVFIVFWILSGTIWAPILKLLGF